MPATLLIAGLGNPGAKYDQTRHNAGFWFLEALARRYQLNFRSDSKFHGLYAKGPVEGAEQLLLMPTTFMNRSGQAVKALASYFKLPPDHILVVHDELDLPPGQMKLKKGGGHGGHNGLRDIDAQLGTRDYHRLRLGIGHPGDAKRVVDYVLKQPGQTDRRDIDDAIEIALDNLALMINGDWARATNFINGHK